MIFLVLPHRLLWVPRSCFQTCVDTRNLDGLTSSPIHTLNAGNNGELKSRFSNTLSSLSAGNHQTSDRWRLDIFTFSQTQAHWDTVRSVVYQRLCDNKSRIHCSFLIGKVRLAPIKTVMIPRLKMTAATVSIRFGEMMNKELDDKPDIIQHHTESTAMLRYIGNDQKRFQVFFANRAQLCNFSDPSHWRYVET